MFFYEGLSCPVCGKAFEDHEDIVSCPICGAPHHRDCWKSEGHCHFEDKHGTADQWSKEKAAAAEKPADTRRCPHCGADNSPFVEFCGHCGRPIEGQPWQSSPRPGTPDGSPFQAPPAYGEYAPYRIHPVNQFGGVEKDAVIGGVSAEDLAAAVGQNTAYYLPRFSRMDREKRSVSFNWAAFLFPECWLMFRKNYLFGGLVLLFSLLSTALTSYVQIVKLGWLNTVSAPDMYNQLYDIMYTGDPRTVYLYLIAGLGILYSAIRVVAGLFGNYFYLQTCLGRVAKLQKQSPTTYKTQLRTIGGVSIGLLLLTVIINYAFSYVSPMLVEWLISL